MRYMADSRPKAISPQVNTPGPGAYASPSAFGNTQKYLKSDLMRTDSTMIYKPNLNNTTGKIRTSTTRSSMVRPKRRR